MEYIITIDGRLISINTNLVPAFTFERISAEVYSFSTIGLHDNFYDVRFNYKENEPFAQHMGLRRMR